MFREELESLSLILVFFPFFIPAIIFDSCISHLASILFLISFEIMCSLYMYYCSDRWLLWFRFIACLGYFRLPRVYTSPTLVATPFPRILGSGAWQYIHIPKINESIKEFAWRQVTQGYTCISKVLNKINIYMKLNTLSWKICTK